MASLLSAVAIILAICVGGVRGQGRMACPSISASDCYFQGAATLPTDEPSPSKRFNIGGFFDIHKKGESAYTCSAEMSKEGILYLQAFLWAIRRYETVRFMANDISVGAFAFDSCMRSEQNVENMLSYAQCKLQLQGLPQTNLVAYVGPYDNTAVESLAHLASDLSVPLLAPVANSPGLMYEGSEFLLKLSPSFNYDVDSTLSLLRRLDVKFVILLYDGQSPFWRAASQRLADGLASTSTCVHLQKAYYVSDTASIVSDLEERQMVRYVVPLMTRDMMDHLLEGVKGRASISTNSFRFILNIGQDRVFMASKSVTVNNSLVVDRTIKRDYDVATLTFANELLTSPTGQLGSANISWISDYYQKYPNDLPRIDDSTEGRVRYGVAKTIEAVDGIMRGMASAIDICSRQSGQFQVCDEFRNQPNKGEALLQQISEAAFGSATANGQLQMSDIQYKVYHYFVPRSNTGPVFNEVATVSVNNDGTMTTELTEDLLDNTKYGVQFSDSACPSDGECCIPPTTAPPPTTEAVEATEQPAATTDPNKSKYVAAIYPRGQEITGAYVDAERGDGEYGTRFDDNHEWIIALGVLAGLGVLSVLIFEIYILYKLLGTRLGNKWRTMWLGQLLLFGVLMCYLTLFAYIPVPTKATCGITRFGVGVSYSICFAVLLVKLMVILTSRSSSDVLLPGDAESPNYLKGIYQFLMFIFAVGVQVVIDVQWLITVPPEAVPVISNNGQRVWVCNHYTWEAGREMDRMDGWVRTNFENHVLSLSYIMVMILITTVLSLNAHGIITNHRESVFIGIAAGFSIPIWLAWGLVGGFNEDHDYAQEFGDACIAFGLFLTATLILFSMFLPKVRQLVNMGVEGIYLEDDRDTYYAGSIIMAPPSYRSKGPNSVYYVNNQGIYSEPVVIGNGDPSKDRGQPGSTYSAPPAFVKKPASSFGGSKVLRMTDDLKGLPQKPRSEAGTTRRARSTQGTIPRSRSTQNLGAL